MDFLTMLLGVWMAGISIMIFLALTLYIFNTSLHQLGLKIGIIGNKELSSLSDFDDAMMKLYEERQKYLKEKKRNPSFISRGKEYEQRENVHRPIDGACLRIHRRE